MKRLAQTKIKYSDFVVVKKQKEKQQTITK
jgi:hypothetical protein